MLLLRVGTRALGVWLILICILKVNCRLVHSFAAAFLGLTEDSDVLVERKVRPVAHGARVEAAAHTKLQ